LTWIYLIEVVTAVGVLIRLHISSSFILQGSICVLLALASWYNNDINQSSTETAS
jgi:hypothetical protein